ncbi:hypothetical protein C5167_046160 [Papaver somniferum]|uniref:Uncharacterized protein n=1 Tax=Papaver somniferum TaxID=3469 RepID=A0A4Y7LGU5_PAPSO|nr:hypothetical protein C5167_046160 [Papaver somniferum]
MNIEISNTMIGELKYFRIRVLGVLPINVELKKMVSIKNEQVIVCGREGLMDPHGMADMLGRTIQSAQNEDTKKHNSGHFPVGFDKVSYAVQMAKVTYGLICPG